VLDGATVIGLVDGRYEDVAAVWHKEILFALEKGVSVIGGASLGALRAVECAEFGMIGIGEIFQAYRDGRRIDDADVAQLHGPSELDFRPITEALVNVEATFDRLHRQEILSDEHRVVLTQIARNLHFKERTFERIFDEAPLSFRQDRELQEICRHYRVDQKQRDAVDVVSFMANLPADHRRDRPGWSLAEPPTWRALLAGLQRPTQLTNGAEEKR
jgi:hypothetical protein